MATTAPDEPLDMREQLARIDKMQAETRKLLADLSKVQQDTRLAVWTVVTTALGAGAALFAAGATFIKLVG